jgi:hypothetical protein
MFGRHKRRELMIQQATIEILTGRSPRITGPAFRRREMMRTLNEAAKRAKAAERHDRRY